jgi:cytidylate kinase
MIRIVAIEREFGSGGGVIGAKVAEQLGWRLLDQELTEEIAKLANVECGVVEECDEKVDPLLYRLTKVFWRGSYERVMPIPDQHVFDADRMVQLVQQVMENAAKEGNCVIVGRGAPWFLRGRADTFSVFFYAPRAEKIRRLKEQVPNEEEANELLDTIDSERIAYVRRYFGKQWPTRSLYHSMLNTQLGDEICVSTVLNMIDSVNQLCSERSAVTEEA